VTVLVDTTIWSLALRRRAHQLSADEKRLVKEWADLVTEGRAGLTGPVRQEVLSGIRSHEAFEALHEKLSFSATLRTFQAITSEQPGSSISAELTELPALTSTC
jgi:predicted nucleic acid-binding protein